MPVANVSHRGELMTIDTSQALRHDNRSPNTVGGNEGVSVSMHDVLLVPEDMQCLRHPHRPVSAPPVPFGVEAYEEGNRRDMPPLPARTPSPQVMTAQDQVRPDPANNVAQSPGSLAPRFQGSRSDRTLLIMREVATMFDIGLDVYDHIEWLVQQGLVNDLQGAVHAAVVAGVPMKETFSTPIELASVNPPAHSISLPAVTGVPVSWAQASGPERFGQPSQQPQMFQMMSPRVAPHKVVRTRRAVPDKGIMECPDGRALGGTRSEHTEK